MRTSVNYVTNRTIGYSVAFLLLLCPDTASAITYMSIEPVPNMDVVGENVVVTHRNSTSLVSAVFSPSNVNG